MEAENKAIELSDAILKSNEYIRFISAKNKIASDESLAKRTREYRISNIALQKNGNLNKEDLKRFANEYNDVLSNSIAREYIDSEIALCKKLRNINSLVYNDIDIDTINM